MEHNERILIIDFGSQYTQLITRRIREANVFSEIYPHTITAELIRKLSPKGIIFSGGPMSVYDKDAPEIDEQIFKLGIPILGICYGLQLIAKKLGGKVEPASDREYGKAVLSVRKHSVLFEGTFSEFDVWMSHGDYLTGIPSGFEVLAVSDHTPYCAVEDNQLKIYGVQFHPEVVHTQFGEKIIRNFLYRICNCKGEWTPGHFISQSIDEIRNKVGNEKAICALSGGVDSTVAAVLVQRAIGDNLIAVHIDTGLMRKNESTDVAQIFKEKLALRYIHIDAGNIFLDRLKGISDPEQKRKIIGSTFIEVFEKKALEVGNVKFLVQGTLYPDVIESVSVQGKSVTIKTHHNVGGLPEKMNIELIEPFRELFKDEVRKVGREMNIPEEFIKRHPFPGPGLAVRILGEVNRQKLDILREADDIFVTEIIRAGLYDKIWQAFAVLLPVRSVGVMGDARTYENVLALRAVTSVDGMTADWFDFDHKFLSDVSNKIINKIRGINRVVYDISSKPPSTIEWE